MPKAFIYICCLFLISCTHDMDMNNKKMNPEDTTVSGKVGGKDWKFSTGRTYRSNDKILLSLWTDKVKNPCLDLGTAS